MTRVTLRQIIGRQSDARALVETIVEALGTPVAVEDAEGRLLHGEASANGASRYPVPARRREHRVGSGSDARSRIAALLGHLTAREGERKALGAEVLHLYREINLIYSFSEKLAALLDVERRRGAHAGARPAT